MRSLTQLRQAEAQMQLAQSAVATARFRNTLATMA
jgi:hypothetical protein